MHKLRGLGRVREHADAGREDGRQPDVVCAATPLTLRLVWQLLASHGVHVQRDAVAHRLQERRELRILRRTDGHGEVQHAEVRPQRRRLHARLQHLVACRPGHDGARLSEVARGDNNLATKRSRACHDVPQQRVDDVQVRTVAHGQLVQDDDLGRAQRLRLFGLHGDAGLQRVGVDVQADVQGQAKGLVHGAGAVVIAGDDAGVRRNDDGV